MNINILKEKWFEVDQWILQKNITWIVSKEVLEWANIKNAWYYAEKIFKLFIKKKLEKQLNLEKLIKNEILLIIAHWKSTSTYWKIFWLKQDLKGIDMEEFISYLPKNKIILLYVCNKWKYKLNIKDKKIIYPLDITSKEDLQFDIINLNL